MRFTKLALVALASVAVTGCASHKYVDKQIAALDAAHTTRMNALTARVDQIDQTSRDALARAIAAGKLAEGKFVYTVVLSDDSVKFKSGKAEISDAGKTQLAAFATQLKTDNKNVYLEIQGHTDSRGSDAMNISIGQKRADAVRNYLGQQGVALHRMATTSYGESTPIASNKTSDGRSKNRRVTIVVLN